MSSLTPDKRMDRNGNMVTRWVRSVRGLVSREAARAIPAPHVSEPINRNALLRGEADRVLVQEDGYGHRYTANMDFVMKHDPQLVRSVLDECSEQFKKSYWASTFNERFIAPQLGDWKYEDPEPDLIESSLSVVRKGLITTDEAVRLFTNEDRDHYFCKKGGLYYLDSVGRRLAPKKPTDDELRACTLIGYLHGVHEGRIFCDNLKVPQGDVDYFIENYDQIKPLAPFLFERNITDVGFIDGLITGIEPALADGVL